MSDTSLPLPRSAAIGIARAFLPARAWGSRHHYFYARGKLSSDPLYPGVAAALDGTTAPLLDLGCGLGLLAHALRTGGIALPYLGVDNDAGKLASAQRAAARAALQDVRFERVDLATGTPPVHRGSVAVLDVLQYLPVERHLPLLSAAIDMLVPGSRLVIRTGLDDGSRRARFTRVADMLGHAFGWMNTHPRCYPDPDALRGLLAAHGLHGTFSSLSGNTPFNNWLIVAERR